MKKIFLFSICCFCFSVFANSQSVVFSKDGKAMTYNITQKTSVVSIVKADSVLKSHGIDISIKATRSSGLIKKLEIKISSAKGSVVYNTESVTDLEKGILISVDDSENAKVPLSVGPNNSKQ